MHKCQSCSGYHNLIDPIKSNALKYMQWITTDKSTLELLECDLNSFMEKVSNSVNKLLRHSCRC